MDEEDSKPAVASSTILPPRRRRRCPQQQQKRRKDNSGMAVVGLAPEEEKEEGAGGEICDVAEVLNFRPGDRLEVKWTIVGDEDDNDDHVDDAGEGEGERRRRPRGPPPPPPTTTTTTTTETKKGGVTVWWAATLVKKTDRTHVLADEERGEGTVRVPIYELNYVPLEEHGFDSHSAEDVAFVSNTTLLNLSTDEIMTFRRAGEPSPPSSPAPSYEGEGEEAEGIAREFLGQDEMMAFMNRTMQRCLKNTGIDVKMRGLPMSQQLIMAERIRKAKEGMLERILEETGRMGTGEKVITEDVIRRCVAQMPGRY